MAVDTLSWSSCLSAQTGYRPGASHAAHTPRGVLPFAGVRGTNSHSCTGSCSGHAFLLPGPVPFRRLGLGYVPVRPV